MNIPYYIPSIGEDEINEVVNTLRTGWLTMGPKTIEFENMLAEYLGARNIIAVSSCTAALHLSLVGLGIGIGDEVITTPYTFVSTANVIVHTGAKPVFVDIRKDTYNIDPSNIRKVISSRTKAIIPVDFAGQPSELDEIMEIAKEYNLHVIEDAAHSIGAEYKGKKIGTLATTTNFSFYPTKNITTGEGGAIATENDGLADKLRVLRLHGINKDAWKRYHKGGSWYYEVDECGWKYNMTDIQAAIGIHQLKKLDRFIERRREIAKMYTEEFENIEEVIVPYEKPNSKHTYHLYPFLLKNFNRNKFIDNMLKKGIRCSVHFIPLHLQPFYRNIYGFKKGDYPNAEWVYEREVSLPLYPLMSDNEVYYVIDNVKKIIKS